MCEALSKTTESGSDIAVIAIADTLQKVVINFIFFHHESKYSVYFKGAVVPAG